jgi:serine/threonine-protein kinase
MTRGERIQLIRANGDPRIALRIRVRDADRSDAAPRPSPVVENLLKERIRSFGFRTVSDEAGDPGRPADFLLMADATVRRLSTRLEASGITITKYAVAAMTVKCVDVVSGEDIYFSTALPKGTGSFATEDEALKVLGERIADEFSRDLFLQHVNVSGRRVSLVIDGLPDRASDALQRELAGLPAVIAARPRASVRPGGWDLELAGSGSAGELVGSGVLAPLNAKLGQACLALGATSGSEVKVSFEAGCNAEAVLSRLDTLPPAGLYGAPPARRSAVIRNPETLRKLSI